VGLDQGPGDGQPDARSSVGPVPRGVNPVETFEDMGKVLGGDALASVFDGQRHLSGSGR
jgi:hypothetical protein